MSIWKNILLTYKGQFPIRQHLRYAKRVLTFRSHTVLSFQIFAFGKRITRAFSPCLNILFSHPPLAYLFDKASSLIYPNTPCTGAPGKRGVSPASSHSSYFRIKHATFATQHWAVSCHDVFPFPSYRRQVLGKEGYRDNRKRTISPQNFLPSILCVYIRRR